MSEIVDLSTLLPKIPYFNAFFVLVLAKVRLGKN